MENEIEIGTFEFKVTLNPKDGWYVAQGKTSVAPEGTMITQGRNMEELMCMAADAYLCVLGVKCSWWNRFVWRLPRYGRNMVEELRMKLLAQSPEVLREKLNDEWDKKD